MTYLSTSLSIGENYTRGQLCDLMGIRYFNEEIERGVYKSSKYSSVLVFSTLINRWNYFNKKLNETIFLYSGTNSQNDNYILQHQYTNNELLLFIRETEQTGFYYFGRCKFVGKYSMKYYFYPLYGLELRDAYLSRIQEIQIPLAG